MEHLVFVYGTLRENLDNHHYLRGKSTFLGMGRTVSRYAMYVGGLIPYVKENEPRYRIRGELYRVNDAVLAELDALEEHPRDYVRRQIEIECDDAARHIAWLYFHPAPPGRLMPTGDYRDTPGTL